MIQLLKLFMPTSLMKHMLVQVQSILLLLYMQQISMEVKSAIRTIKINPQVLQSH